MSGSDVAVIGGGIIGSAIAWRLARSGWRVTVYDREEPGMASKVAAGLLAPVTEAGSGEPDLADLMVASARMWPSFAAELNEFAEVAYRPYGTILVGVEPDDEDRVDRYDAFYRQAGLETTRWTGEECRSAEPLLGDRVASGLYAPGDHRVDPRKVLSALIIAGSAVGVERVVTQVADPADLPCDRVILAAGCWSGRWGRLPVRPVPGQVVRLRSGGQATGLRRCVRAINRGRSVYLVPRDDGEVVVGASSREPGYDTSVMAGETAALLTDAIAVVPELAGYRLIETNVGLRPGTPDNGPLLGPIADGRLIAATGHYRNGVLMAPVTAELVARYLADGVVPPAMARFAADRFS